MLVFERLVSGYTNQKFYFRDMLIDILFREKKTLSPTCVMIVWRMPILFLVLIKINTYIEECYFVETCLWVWESVFLFRDK